MNRPWVEERHLLSVDTEIGGNQLNDALSYVLNLTHHVREQYPMNEVPVQIVTELKDLRTLAEAFEAKAKTVIMTLRHNRVPRPGAP